MQVYYTVATIQFYLISYMENAQIRWWIVIHAMTSGRFVSTARHLLVLMAITAIVCHGPTRSCAAIADVLIMTFVVASHVHMLQWSTLSLMILFGWLIAAAAHLRRLVLQWQVLQLLPFAASPIRPPSSSCRSPHPSLSLGLGAATGVAPGVDVSFTQMGRSLVSLALESLHYQTLLREIFSLQSEVANFAQLWAVFICHCSDVTRLMHLRVVVVVIIVVVFVGVTVDVFDTFRAEK